MAKIIIPGYTEPTNPSERYWTYNGLDCCVTHEVWGVLRPRAVGGTDRIYRFHMATQKPALVMAWRGLAVDNKKRTEGIAVLVKDIDDACNALDALLGPLTDGVELNTGECPARPGKKHRWPRMPDDDPTKLCKDCGIERWRHKRFNPMSDDQCKTLFYAKLDIPPHKNKKGIVSVDKEVLDRLEHKYEDKPCAVYVRAIRHIRDMDKQRSMLSAGLSADGRMRSSFNPGTTETDRWSSTTNAYREGGNLQNIPGKLRHVFVADPGMELFYADLAQAESNCVAHLSDDEQYIAAHLAGDVHTYVTRLVWPELPWSGDLAKDRQLAEKLSPPWDPEPEHNYRFQGKRIQHGSNLGMTPIGVARVAHIPQKVAVEMQERYFTAFPGIRRWQKEIDAALTNSGVLVSPINRKRQFFGRPWDGHTRRQAYAFQPQSMVVAILNVAINRVFSLLDPGGRVAPRPGTVYLLAQVHDAILGARTAGDDGVIEKVRECMRVPVPINGRTLVLKTDVAIGRNWGKFHPTKNPEGMK